ncbi:MAG: hypothetical protein AAF431_14730 [Pseudomonadota bacterium]
MIIRFTSALVVAALLAGCASNSKYVPRHQSYTTLKYGSIIAKEEVTIGGTNSGIGSWVGSAAAIHDSTSHSFVGFVLRGLAGAFVGSAVEEAVTRKDGMLYTVEMKNGALIEVVSTNTELARGECVQVAHSGRRHTELEPASASFCVNQPIQKTGAITAI